MPGLQFLTDYWYGIPSVPYHLRFSSKQLSTWQLASIGTGKQENRRGQARWKPQFFYNLISEVIFISCCILAPAYTQGEGHEYCEAKIRRQLRDCIPQSVTFLKMVPIVQHDIPRFVIKIIKKFSRTQSRKEKYKLFRLEKRRKRRRGINRGWNFHCSFKREYI